MSPRPALRADLVDLTGYHSPQIDVPVRLNTNESPFPAPESFVERFAAAVKEIPFHRYPDRGAADLRAATADFLGQPRERVFCANGSNEVLQTLLLAYGGSGRRAAVFRPSYLLHEQISRITGTEVVAGDRDADFTLDPDAVRAVLDDHAPDVTFLCSPNNPTGIVESREAIEAVVDAAPGLVVVDEAYGEFADWSAADLVTDDGSVVVVRTFSKVWSLAALRLGCCIAPPPVVDDLEKIILPYHLSALTQTAGTLALEFRDDMEKRVETIVCERERMQTALADMAGLTVYPSGANFLLFRPEGDGAAIWRGLLDRGVLVRDCSSWRGLEGCLRVTVGTSEENDAFLAAIEEVLS